MEINLTWSEPGVLPEAARDIRTEVFIKEQGFVDEFDEIDARSWHVLLHLDGKPCGTARLFWDEEPGFMRIGRLALLPHARGGGYGRAVLSQCCKKARVAGAQRVVLDAQKRAKGFYEACGFETRGDEFLEEDYPHYRMELELGD